METQAPITLYSFGPAFGVPELSPYCSKSEVQLQMAGLVYRVERAMPGDSPKGQLPFIEDAGVRVADSTFIRSHIEREYGIDLDAALDIRQRAQAWAIERMVENQLMWALVYTRWLQPANFAKVAAHLFAGAPDAVQADALARVSMRVHGVGLTRHSHAEIVELGARSLSALSILLGDQPYLFGDQPSGTDAMVFAVLAGLMAPTFRSDLRREAESHPNLVAYVARMMARYYPQHPWPGVGHESEVAEPALA